MAIGTAVLLFVPAAIAQQRSTTEACAAVFIRSVEVAEALSAKAVVDGAKPLIDDQIKAVVQARC